MMVTHTIQDMLLSIPLRPGSVCQESAMETIQKRTVLSWTELFHLGKKQHNNSISQPSRENLVWVVQIQKSYRLST